MEYLLADINNWQKGTAPCPFPWLLAQPVRDYKASFHAPTHGLLLLPPHQPETGPVAASVTSMTDVLVGCAAPLAGSGLTQVQIGVKATREDDQEMGWGQTTTVTTFPSLPLLISLCFLRTKKLQAGFCPIGATATTYRRAHF